MIIRTKNVTGALLMAIVMALAPVLLADQSCDGYALDTWRGKVLGSPTAWRS